MKYKKDVTDSEVEADYNRVFKTEIEAMLVPRVKPENAVVKPKADPRKNQHEMQSEAKVTTKSNECLTNAEKELLESICETPNLPVTKRTAMLGLSPYKMNKLKDSIISKGLAEQFSINLGKDFGGNITLMALSDTGYTALGKQRITKKLQSESHEHLWWKGMIFRHYKRMNVPAEIEKSIKGKHADVGIKHKGRDIAIEVELTPKNAMTNIIQDIDSGFSQVLSCAKNSRVKDAIVKAFESHPDHDRLNDKVKFRLLSEFDFIKEIINKE